MATIHSSSSFQETEFLSYPLWLDCRKQQFCWSLGPSTSNSLVASISLSWNGTLSQSYREATLATGTLGGHMKNYCDQLATSIKL